MKGIKRLDKSRYNNNYVVVDAENIQLQSWNQSIKLALSRRVGFMDFWHSYRVSIYVEKNGVNANNGWNANYKHILIKGDREKDLADRKILEEIKKNRTRSVFLVTNDRKLIIESHKIVPSITILHTSSWRSGEGIRHIKLERVKNG